MRYFSIILYGSLVVVGAIFLAGCSSATYSTGIFDSSSDVGIVTHTGSAKFFQGSSEYAITGGGANMGSHTNDDSYVLEDI